jgi:hypothetical protein
MQNATPPVGGGGNHAPHNRGLLGGIIFPVVTKLLSINIRRFSFKGKSVEMKSRIVKAKSWQGKTSRKIIGQISANGMGRGLITTITIASQRE